MKKILIISAILIIIFLIAFLKLSNSKKSDPRGDLYAGSATCVKCHRDVYQSYSHTAHFMASLPASLKTINGSFLPGANYFKISPHKKVVLEKKDSSLFQSYYLDGKLKESHRFDIVMGGIKGESYLYWNNDGLNQLPISFYTQEHKWLMSPGYAPGIVDFGRIITMRCLECHASYIADAPNQQTGLNGIEKFDKSTIVYSIDCERCHGPAAKHVDFQTNNPQIKTAHFIAAISSLSRMQRVDMCAQCHSGNKSQMIRSIFSFKPGDRLENFKLKDFYSPASDTSALDVHGNQAQLLESSKCYIHSQINCTTCHDTHQNQRDNISLFTLKCLGCHSSVSHNYCKLANNQNDGFLKSNCIKCHMPAFTTKAILSANMDSTYHAQIFVRTHHIAIYPQETKKILAMVGK